MGVGTSITRQELLSSLRISEEELSKLIQEKGNYYRSFVILETKKDGRIKERPITESLGRLKMMQKWIHRFLLNNIQFPECVHGGIRKRSNITHCYQHKNGKYRIFSDLKNFYPSISTEMVSKACVQVGFSKQVSKVIAEICTHNGKVPQGAPSSTTISNVAFFQADLALMRVAMQNGITYCRYIDDLAFSSSTDFKAGAGKFFSVIEKHGFLINTLKTSYKIGPGTTTGINIYLDGLVPEDKFMNSLKNIANWESPSAIGKLNYYHSVTGEHYPQPMTQH